MKNKELNEVDNDILERLLEYCKYLYEEEKERTDRIEKKLNIFTFVLGGSVLGVLMLPIGKLSMLLSNPNEGVLVFVVLLFSASILLFLFSSIFTILVYKVRRFEMPSDPKIATIKSISMESKKDLLSAIIADYSIATNRNHDINDKKASHLSKALIFLLAGLVSFALSLFIFNITMLLKGGR